VRALAQQATQNGTTVHTDVSVNNISYKDKMFCLSTSKGTFNASDVVVATNAFAPELIPELRGIIIPDRGQVVATQPIPKILPFNLVSYGSTGVTEYMIQRDADNRVIFGGFGRESENNVIDDTSINESIHSEMVEYLDKKYGIKAQHITNEWTGIMSRTKDGYPLVGKLAGRKEYLACGYHGHGMAMAFKAAHDVAQLVLGNQQAIPKEFNPDRFFQQ